MPQRPANPARASLAAGLVAAAALAGALTAAGPAAAAPAPTLRPACPRAPHGYMRCFALYQPQTSVNRAIAKGLHGPSAQPQGWSPQNLRSAYKLPAATTSDQTVAISIAYNTPHLARDLATYRQHYGLPPCTAASGCLRVVNQQGSPSPLPASGVPSGWDVEELLDISMVSAACPHCHILVVEADNASGPNLAATEDTAARLGAQVISNSYGAPESGLTLTEARHYTHPGHTVVVAAGDSGIGIANFPADLSSVTAVGGTMLARAHNGRGWSERVWNAGGGAGSSGCSAYVRKPAWQHDPHCPGRTVADVAAVAWDVPIYDDHHGGWLTVGGTSVAAPFIAGVYGLAGNAATEPLGSLYTHTSGLFDITEGNNAVAASPQVTCGDDYLCVAKEGYDAPTGVGSPDGTGAF